MPKYLDVFNDNICIDYDESISVLHYNIRGLVSKLCDLKVILNRLCHFNLDVDIICLCETFLNTLSKNHIHLNNYNLYSLERESRKGGGVAIFVNNELDVVEVTELKVSNNSVEGMFLKITNANIIIGEVYRIPNSDLNVFQTYINEVLAYAKNSKSNCIIAGDFNLNLLATQTHNRTAQFLDSMLSSNFVPTIQIPTRVFNDSKTLIDNIFCEGSLLEDFTSHVLSADFSDHYPCLTVIKREVYVTRVETVRYSRKLNDEKYCQINALLRNQDWSNVYGAQDIHAASCKLTENIISAFDRVAPLKICKPRGKLTSTDPWLSNSILKSISYCHKLYKEWKKNGKNKTSADYTKYIEYKRVLQKVKCKAKYLHFKTLINKFRGESKCLWSILNSIIKKKSNSTLTNEMIIDGVNTSSKRIISNSFAKYYGEIGIQLSEKLSKSQPGVNVNNFKEKACDKTFHFFPVSNDDVKKHIMKLKPKTSSGCDGISNVMLKETYEFYITPLTYLINKSLSDAEYPDNYKIATIKPLYKSKNKTELKNYRPISLLPVLSKILEKVVHKQIMSFLNKNNLLYQGQYGFRCKRSTNDALLDIVGNIIENFEKGLITVAIMLDTSKAFDCINHDIFLSRIERYGMRGHVKNWFESYLRNRLIKVNFNGCISEEYTINIGTPQGSVLGPVYYIWYIDSLVRNLRYSALIIYADDTTLLLSGKNIGALVIKCENDLDILYKWFVANGLTINTDKTYYMIYNYILRYEIQIHMGGVILTQTDCTKLLGVWIQNDLKWESHLDMVAKKLAYPSYVLRSNKNIFDKKTIKLLYHSIFESQLLYGLPLWGPPSQNTAPMRRIEKIQSKLLTDLSLDNDVLSIGHLIELACAKISY